MSQIGDHKLAGENENTSPIGLTERSFPVAGMSCGACVGHVESALRTVSGVAEVKVSLARGRVEVSYDPAVTDFTALSEAVGAAGYELRKDSMLCQSTSTQASVRAMPLKTIVWPAFIGLIASALLFSVYILIVGITQDFGHAIGLVMDDWYFVIPIVFGFGVQIALFVYVRRVLKLRKGARSANALTGAGTGTSTVSMIACCAHHLTDVAPVLGLSGAAVFLNDNRGPFMTVGIATNLVGIAVMIRMIRKIGGRVGQSQ